MTTFAVPPIGSPAWREIYLSPPDVHTGRWCPIDDTTLRPRLDGWACPACDAAWDFRGMCGRWLADTAAVATVEPSVRWRVSPAAVAGVAGCALAAAGLVAVLGEFDERLVWWLAAVVVAVPVLLLAWAWLARQVEDRRYRHNQVRLVDGEVTR